MEQKRFQDYYQKLMDFLETPMAERIFIIAASFLSGFACSRGLVFGKYSPFGVAVLSAVPRKGLLWSFIGITFGYILPSASYVPARYIAAGITVIAIRWCLSELKNINTHGLYAPLITFLPLLATGMAMVFIDNSVGSTAALYLAESFLAAGCSYFFVRTVKLITSSKSKNRFDSTDIASLTLSIGVLTLSLGYVTISGVSIGRIFMIILIMYCANSGGIAGGAISGITAGAIQSLSTSGLTYISGAYGLGGLMAGVFASMGKMFGAIAFIIAHGVASLQIGDSESIMISAVEVGVATVIFMILPKSAKISEIFMGRGENINGNSLRRIIISRLNFASESLSHVSNSVEEIAKKLNNSPGIKGVLNSSVAEVCAGCSANGICWKKERETTLSSFVKLANTMKVNSRVTEEDFPVEITNRCSRVTLLKESLNKHYREFKATEELELKSAQMRTITGEQFVTTSYLLKDIAKEFSNYQFFDEESGDRVEEILKKHNVYPSEVCCRIDKFGRMTIEAEIEKRKQGQFNKAYFTREVSVACGRTFSQPCINLTNNIYRITMTEKPQFDVAFGHFQHSAENSTFCGDSISCFYDGQGRYITIISDGMGTGGRAAVDGVMASSMAESLLKGGIGYDTTLRIINSALMSKSSDESLATLDIASIDLFTGKAEFRKAGATGTFIRRGRRVDYVEEISLPVGIMSNISFASFEETLKENDIILMVSDGATACGTDWIKEIVGNFEDDDPANLAKQIVTEAKKQRNDGHEDDITALAIKIK